MPIDVFTESDIQAIRKLFFPLVSNNLVSGYNVYSNHEYSPPQRFLLRYLHSDLTLDHQHFVELSDLLKEHHFAMELPTIRNSLCGNATMVDRDTVYINQKHWEDPANMVYFDFNGNPLSKEQAKSGERDVIGESLQYELCLGNPSRHSLRSQLDFFKKYTCAFEIDALGRIIYENEKGKPNSSAIPYSWEVPLIICIDQNSTKKPKYFKDLMSLSEVAIEFTINDKPFFLKALIKRTETKIITYLKSQGYFPRVQKVYTLRVFADYIDS